MYSLLKKAVLFIVFVLFYFLGIRELRGIVHDLHMGTVLPDEYGEVTQELNFYSQSSVSFTFKENAAEQSTEWQYKIPFGVFFLFGSLGLIVLGSKVQFYFYLAGMHLISGFISFICLVLALNFVHEILIIPDMLSRYLIPLCSLGFVALVYLQQKNKIPGNVKI